MAESSNKEQAPGAIEQPGFVCPFCGTDCSPITGDPPCEHLFLVDGENGWRFSPAAAALFAAAGAAKQPTLFRDLLYHDPACREYLRLRRAVYDDSLELYAFSADPPATEAAFRDAIGAAGAPPD
jgi:hypothetical protein